MINGLENSVTMEQVEREERLLSFQCFVIKTCFIYIFQWISQ